MTLDIIASTPPSLLILDEPTNHLDIDSIETVEEGLRYYDGALVIVSHDEVFLGNIRTSRNLVINDANVLERNDY